MSAWVGFPGSLVELRHGSVQTARAGRSNFRTTVGGRVKEQRAPALGRRSWDVSLDFYGPGEASGFASLILAGAPPWSWITDAAARTNVLSPEQSLLLPGSWSGAGYLDGGRTVTADGVFAARTLIRATGGDLEFGYRAGVPDRPAVVPGVPVTWSAYLRGSGVLFMQYLDSGGAVVSEESKTYNNSTLQRVSLSRTPPARAASVRLTASGALQAGLPSLSWTVAEVPWAVGDGCNRVSVDGFSDSARAAVGGLFSGYDFTIREVG